MKNIFNTYWPQFENEFTKIIKETKEETVVEKRPQEDILTEVLNSIRSMDRRLRHMEFEKEPIAEEKPRKINASSLVAMVKINNWVDLGIPDEQIIENLKGSHELEWIIQRIKLARERKNK